MPYKVNNERKVYINMYKTNHDDLTQLIHNSPDHVVNSRVSGQCSHAISTNNIIYEQHIYEPHIYETPIIYTWYEPKNGFPLKKKKTCLIDGHVREFQTSYTCFFHVTQLVYGEGGVM